MFKFRIGDKVKVLTGKYKKMHGVIRDIVPKKYQAIINTNSKGKKKS